MYSNHSTDPRRPDKEHRYKPKAVNSDNQALTPGEDLTSDYMNILGMILSMCGLLMKFKWAAWCAMFCSCISFANSKASDDNKQIFSSFMAIYFPQHLPLKVKLLLISLSC
ncbi:protein Asterix isoform X1 [Acyrthosiphon pisum]|uniref:Protein Asterix n=1 Tax=Acyrthosiphon pisum TaxID=7029 RepID=A0A8R2JRA2_ACYPI|nr:protein Asterix isoform X1 [Acyrthosiphon pisum]|eukprot:XP_008183188.1 PREDICTED: protein Asterix isoform X2 [Acyrthosiphon pisum]